MRRLPIKLKLTFAFVGVMTVVLTATGLFLYFRLRTELDHSIAHGLRGRADAVALFVRQRESGLRAPPGKGLEERGESFVQLLDTRGRVLDASPEASKLHLLTAEELIRANRETVTVDHNALPDPDEPAARILATPVQAGKRRFIVAVGGALGDRNEALANLLRLLLIGGPAALLLASVAGYGVATASLRPVESMRRRAEAISAAKRGQKLPVPPTNDEIGRLGDTLNEMLARLEKALERERRFVSDASHELRMPLAVLKTELELALRRGRSKEELESALKSATEETDRVVRLAEDLLVIARSDQGRLPVRPARMNAHEVLANVRDRFAARSRELDRPLLVEAPEGLQIVADPLRLRQALGNLVDNAFRYGEGPVQLSAQESNGRVELHVRDAGPGFPETFIASAFERFTRAEEGRARGGTGLGLAIVAAIANAHTGKARAANQPSGGADVWLELPGAGRRRDGS